MFRPDSVLLEVGTRYSYELEVSLRSWEARLIALTELFNCEEVKSVS
jgi:hypothetical protein